MCEDGFPIKLLEKLYADFRESCQAYIGQLEKTINPVVRQNYSPVIHGSVRAAGAALMLSSRTLLLRELRVGGRRVRKWYGIKTSGGLLRGRRGGIEWVGHRLVALHLHENTSYKEESTDK